MNVIYTEIDANGNPTGKTIVVDEPDESPACEADGTFVTEPIEE